MAWRWRIAQRTIEGEMSHCRKMKNSASPATISKAPGNAFAWRVECAAAVRAIKGWLDGGVMKPDDLRKASRVTSLECVYLPFYVFEVDATTAYAGVLTRTGTNERRNGNVRRDYFWKILGRRSGDFPTQDYKLPLALKVPFNTGGMVRDSRFLNAEVDEDEAERLTREEVDGHQRGRR